MIALCVHPNQIQLFPSRGILCELCPKPAVATIRAARAGHYYDRVIRAGFAWRLCWACLRGLQRSVDDAADAEAVARWSAKTFDEDPAAYRAIVWENLRDRSRPALINNFTPEERRR